MTQEYIAVGCVPSAAVAVSRGVGVCLLPGVGGGSARGVSASGGVCFGGCLLRDVSAWGGLLRGEGVCSWGVSASGGVCSKGVSAPGGICSGGCLLQGVSALGGGMPACTEADTPTPQPVDRQTPVKTLPSQLRCVTELSFNKNDSQIYSTR